MSYAGRCFLPERLMSIGAFGVIERADGVIFMSDANHTLQCSTDDGYTWFTPSGASGIQVRTDSIQLNSLGEILFGSIATFPSIYYATPTSCTVATPSPLPGANTSINRISADIGGVMYAIGDTSASAYKSTDHGHTWTAFSCTFPGGTIGHAYALEVNTYGLWMGGEIGSLNLSTDGGSSWTDWGLSPATRHNNMWVCQQSPYTGSLFVAVGDPIALNTGFIQVHRNADGVGVWNHVSGQAGTFCDHSGFIFQPDGSVISGANYSGHGLVWKSTDDGANWTEISKSKIGVTFAGMTRLSASPSGRLYMSDNIALIRKHYGSY